mgnify:CR=1 FL=1
MERKIVAIILGNRLNDDSTITKIQEERLQMALEIEELFKPDYFILSGGVANPLAKISEAEAMYNYLVEKGIDKDKLIKEDQSHSTVENALYSVPIAKELGAKTIILSTSLYHFKYPGYKTMETFIGQLEDSGITLLTYSNK